MIRLAAALFFWCFISFQALAQPQTRGPKENDEAFLNRISNGRLLPGQLVKSDLNTKGDKLIYFYNQNIASPGAGKDSIKTLRMVILVSDTANPLQYETMDLELDTDQGYGLGIASTEISKTRKEKSLKLAVYHLVPGPGRVRMKNYEYFTLRQRSNNAGFFNDFELIRQR